MKLDSYQSPNNQNVIKINLKICKNIKAFQQDTYLKVPKSDPQVTIIYNLEEQNSLFHSPSSHPPN